MSMIFIVYTIGFTPLQVSLMQCVEGGGVKAGELLKNRLTGYLFGCFFCWLVSLRCYTCTCIHTHTYDTCTYTLIHAHAYT